MALSDAMLRAWCERMFKRIEARLVAARVNT
jgi:hypothetical protein